MKKISLLFLMMVALTAVGFAQSQDSRVVAQWDGTNITVPLVYHLEVWDQNGATTDIGQFLTPVNNLRKYGAVSFLIHGGNGYIVVLYASPDWAPALQKPQGVTSKYTVAGDHKQVIRTLLDSREFKHYITRNQFIIDLETTFAGLK
ncbi:hypothetical protein FACS1894130_08200 [Spirochaetia bacterium]|nr:hypothetical protein FACS1894130_08200 [Spirochaetia bacterium]